MIDKLKEEMKAKGNGPKHGLMIMIGSGYDKMKGKKPMDDDMEDDDDMEESLPAVKKLEKISMIVDSLLEEMRNEAGLSKKKKA
jgi:hypothetical protein